MKIFIVVEYKDVECYTSYGDEKYITETEIISAYGTLREAKCEAQWLNSKNVHEDVIYDVEQTELN
jgi:hypothetical protein